VRNKVAVVACGHDSQLLRAFPSVVHSEHTLSILDQTKHATNPDQHTARIQRVQASPPEMVDLYALVGRHSDEAFSPVTAEGPPEAMIPPPVNVSTRSTKDEHTRKTCLRPA